MKNRGSTPILTNTVGVHPRNIHTKFEANPCSGLRGEVEKLKSSRRQQRQRRQRQRRRRRRTQPDRYSHTHSLSVTKNTYNPITVSKGFVQTEALVREFLITLAVARSRLRLALFASWRVSRISLRNSSLRPVRLSI